MIAFSNQVWVRLWNWNYHTSAGSVTRYSSAVQLQT